MIPSFNIISPMLMQVPLFKPKYHFQWIFRAYTREGARRVECRGCELLTCFSCGAPHHAPTDCSTIRRWLTKCADDSETANYISAHTKVT